MKSCNKVVAASALLQTLVAAGDASPVCPAAFKGVAVGPGNGFKGAEEVQAICQKLTLRYVAESTVDQVAMCKLQQRESPKFSPALKEHMRKRVQAALQTAFEIKNDAAIVVHEDIDVEVDPLGCKEILASEPTEFAPELLLELAYHFDKAAFPDHTDEFLGFAYLAFPADVPINDAILRLSAEAVREKTTPAARLLRRQLPAEKLVDHPIYKSAHHGCKWFGDTVGRSVGGLDIDLNGNLHLPSTTGSLKVDWVSNYTPLGFLNEIEEYKNSATRFTSESHACRCSDVVDAMVEPSKMLSTGSFERRALRNRRLNYNINVLGKRGDPQEAVPATSYGYAPTSLVVLPWDL